PGQAVELARAVEATGCLRLEGLWTHLAVADEPGDRFTAGQLRCFEAVRARRRAAGMSPPLVHAANSAGAMAHPAARYDLVRCGIAVYGYLPAPGMEGELRPVLSLRARVSMVRELEAGERPSYGRRRPLPGRAWVATVPLGYADGVPRRLLDGGMVALVRGQRRPLAGAVTMDQIVLDCGPEPDVAVGDEVVLLGGQGEERVTADDWARALGTISYEVLCGVGPRVPRVPVRGGRPVGARLPFVTGPPVGSRGSEPPVPPPPGPGPGPAPPVPPVPPLPGPGPGPGPAPPVPPVPPLPGPGE
ncbi:MAG: alanine racemase, partial [Acidimicrobiales bacterium]